MLSLEDNRLAEQARDRQRREAQAALECEQLERLRVAETTDRARALAGTEAERHRRDELDQLAKREAMQKAIVEQARIEVDARARGEERELERRHELEIERLRREGAQTSLWRLSGAVGFGGGVMLVVAVLVHVGVLAPAAQRRVVEMTESAAASEHRATDLGRQLDDERRAKASLERKNSELESELSRLVRPVPKTVPPPPRPTSRGGSGGKSGSDHSLPDTCGGPGDPMCPKIEAVRKF